MNPPQKQFSLNRASSRKQIPTRSSRNLEFAVAAVCVAVLLGGCVGIAGEPPPPPGPRPAPVVKAVPPPAAVVRFEYPFDDANWKEAFENIARQVVIINETMVAPEPFMGSRPFVLKRPADGMPRATVGERDYIVFVCPNKNWYAQFAYQIGHELGHFWIGPNSSSWFKESICTGLAFIALEELAKQWADQPATTKQSVWGKDMRSYHDWVSFRPQFDKLGLKNMDAAMAWARKKGPELVKVGAGSKRDEEWAMAKVIERVLRRHPGQWGALTALGKVDGPRDAAGFTKWHSLVTPEQRPLVEDMAASFGLPIGAEEEAMPGFLSPVMKRGGVPDSAPVRVELLSRTTTPRDTLDLEGMAKWSLNYLAGSITAEKDFASSYGNWPLKMPPLAVGGDTIAIGDSEVRNALAFVQMREMCGIDFGATVQKGLMSRILRYQLPCGLFNPASHDDTDVLWATGWMARTLIEEFATTGNREALSRALKALKAVRQYALETNAQGLLRLAPPKELKIDNQIVRFAYRPVLDFCVLEPFVRYYEVTGDKEMLAIAMGLADGRLAGFGTGHDTGHTHSHWHGVIGMAHLGAVTGEKRFLDWTEQQLTRWLPLMTDYGWFEAISGYKASETCAVADLMHVCVYLGRAGRATRYDLVERTIRNYLPQEQFFPDDETFTELWRKTSYPDRDRHLALMRRLEGGFLCRTTPSDRWAENTVSLEGCCPPTGMTGLGLAWRDIVRKTDKGVFVNMAFNHDGDEAAVVSFLPDQGRVTVVAKQRGTFHLRVPGFASHDQVVAWRDGRKLEHVAWTGDYVSFTAAKKGEELTVTYPLVTFVQKLKRGGTDYTVSWKGNAVTRLEPMGQVWPLFKQVPFPTPPYPRKSADATR